MAGRTGAKGHKPKPVRDDSRRKRTIILSADASRRLDAHALGTDQDVGQVVEELILANLRRFSLHDRGSRGLAIADTDQAEGDEAA